MPKLAGRLAPREFVVVVFGVCGTAAFTAKPTTAGPHLGPSCLHPHNCYLSPAAPPAGFATFNPPPPSPKD